MKLCKFCGLVRSLVEKLLGAICPGPTSNAKALDDLIDSIDKALAKKIR